MKKCLFTAALCMIALYVRAQDLETVTGNGNQTSHRIVLDTQDDLLSRLQVAGGIAINYGLNNTSPRPALANGTRNDIRGKSNNSYYSDDGFLRLSAGGGTNANTKSYIDLSGYSTLPDMNLNIVLGTFGLERMRITSAGNIGIGTRTPQSLLAVAGTITAQRVKVTQTGWADDVFDPGYVLPSLPELERYISRNKRLPDIPAEAEIVEHGLDMGEMQEMQMRKIEELTLYLIEQHKKLERQEQLIQELSERVKKLDTAPSR